jgi:threonine dehydrogenase-like Zn-dependent dehydrogenase
MGYVDEQPRVLELLADGELDVTALITETVGLSDAGTALADLARAPGGRIKLLVDPAR